MKLYLTYDPATRAIKSAQVQFPDTTTPDLPAGDDSQVIVDATNIGAPDIDSFFRNFSSYKYDIGANPPVYLDGLDNDRYIAPEQRDNTIPMALGRANTIGDFEAL